MSKEINYFQCEMRKKISNGYISDIAWIPEKFAVVGKFLKIKFTEWEDGWEVVYVGGKRKASEVTAHSRDYKNQRKMSDV